MAHTIAEEIEELRNKLALLGNSYCLWRLATINLLRR